ncbi:hypothetical protein NMY22_g7428 [Coprinellus aureogranulatus]|nr:hypothetical protein NMY22_g7428 [Coprinellus aureogranulatus]
MPYGIVFDRKRVVTADYVGRMTDRGFQGRLIRHDRLHRRSKPKKALSMNLGLPSTTSTGPITILPSTDVKKEESIPPITLGPPSDFVSDTPESAVPLPTLEPLPSFTPDSTVKYPSKIFLPGRSKTSEGSSAQEMMSAWADDKWSIYRDRIVNLQELQSDICDTCHSAPVKWRCLDCLGSPRQCADCCRIAHRAHPFHRIELWTGIHWSPAWLWHTGTCIFLGHGHEPCPKYEASREELESRLLAVNTIDPSNDNSFCAKPEKRTIGFYTCWCEQAPDDDVQFLDGAFYPATWQNIKSAFTFGVMKEFHLLKTHAHMSTEMFLEVKCRLTNPKFPQESPHRRRELARLWSQWNYLMMMMKNGFALTPPTTKPEQGQLALFCAACPQPGINLPDNWTDDKKTWLYRRYLAADGNFVLDHLAKKSIPGRALICGSAYMTEPSRYEKHVKITPEPKEVSFVS